MARLALSRGFMDDFAKLESSIRNKVHQHIELFKELDRDRLYQHKGLHLEAHKDALEPRARTIRIDMNHRGIVIEDATSDLYILTRVGTHDETDRWMSNNRFKVNEATGALEIVDYDELARGFERATEQRVDDQLPLFAHRRDKDFTQLGIEPDFVPALRAFTDENQLQAILTLLPSGQATALIELLDPDLTVEQIYTNIAGTATQVEIAEDDLAAAIDTPATGGEFKIVEGNEELADILRQPLAQWRVFLHPDQKAIAYRENYNGSVRVTGGAGTGKTVVAMHRARALARSIDQFGDDGEYSASKPILFTTYTRNLSEDIKHQLRVLGGNDLLDRVEVSNIDRVAVRMVQMVEGKRPTIIFENQCTDLWQEIIDEQGLKFSPEFLQNEWEQVILAQDLSSRADYFNAGRPGRGFQLNRRDRAEVWKAYEAFIQRTRSKGQRTFLQIADQAAAYARSRPKRPYRHVIVDETQDLHEAQLRLLRALVPEGPNDLFLVGDAHQRIYDRRSSLKKAGINVVGRSKRLRLNYRTTYQILTWSLSLLGEASFDDLDGGVESQHLSEYYSCRSGPMPELSGHDSVASELNALVQRIQTWHDGGVGLEEIGIAVRAAKSLDAAESALLAAGIAVCRLPKDDLPSHEGVRLGTMHRMKGLEFLRVALIDVNDSDVAVALNFADPTEKANVLLRERCLLYVAATRARDGLWVGWSAKPSRLLDAAIAAAEESA